jgi:hypothetical protein
MKCLIPIQFLCLVILASCSLFEGECERTVYFALEENGLPSARSGRFCAKFHHTTDYAPNCVDHEWNLPGGGGTPETSTFFRYTTGDPEACFRYFDARHVEGVYLSGFSIRDWMQGSGAFAHGTWTDEQTGASGEFSFWEREDVFPASASEVPLTEF